MIGNRSFHLFPKLVFTFNLTNRILQILTEAEYTFKLGKCIIPVMMEEYYQPDGWLGIILGSKLYMDFSGKLDQTEEMKKLLREVQTNQAAKVADAGGEFMSCTCIVGLHSQ